MGRGQGCCCISYNAQGSPTRNYLAPNITSATVEKRCSRSILSKPCCMDTMELKKLSSEFNMVKHLFQLPFLKNLNIFFKYLPVKTISPFKNRGVTGDYTTSDSVTQFLFSQISCLPQWWFWPFCCFMFFNIRLYIV